MRRRDLLRASAAAVGGGGATLGLVALADDADAQAALTLEVTGDSATLGADESVTALTLAVDLEWAYDVPDSASPSTVVVELAAATDGDTPTVVASAESAELFTEAEGEESLEAGLLGEVVDGEALAPPDGERETVVDVEAQMRVETSGGEVLAEATATDSAPVTVERTAEASQYGSVGGSGSLTIETGSA
ncbi:hypothetical protein PM085_15670 [Halorubrum ezzemoulense]|uniref:Uncharacterized protein n=1 Tax=Halorubrum ezzemoulense TaxID=337243 RepID=A0ABT4Z895_HALEZ|nr:hypothetical protein [Halorubrum ezzemoulense]MDB2293695.1 hypothetical protein [Halorubrum ezzemoulense]